MQSNPYEIHNNCTSLQVKFLFSWNLLHILTLRNMFIWYLSGFCIWRRLAGRGDRCLHSYKWSLLGSNSHPPHHPSPKCVYFLFPSAQFSICFYLYVVLTYAHPDMNLDTLGIICIKLSMKTRGYELIIWLWNLVVEVFNFPSFVWLG